MSTPEILPNTPILVGGGQITQRKPEDLKASLGPIDLMVEAIERAREDAGLSPEAMKTVDSLRMVNVLTGICPDRIGVLSSRLGIDPTDTVYTRVGANSPQTLVNEAAEFLTQGKISLAVICGAEALNSVTAALTQGIVPDWIARDGAEAGAEPPSFDGTADYEVPYGLQQPINVYPLFENAIRARNGSSIEEHMRYLGELLSPFSEIAMDNPHAWFHQVRTPEEISTVNPSNRMIGFPYPKLMNAIMKVDQSAALIMTTVGKATELGVDPAKWVYLHGCADANDHWYVSERENFYSSPAAQIGGQHALDMAGCTIADIDFIDLYSCFPSAVQFERDALGVDPGDPRPLTVSGGLPYHGGPGNNYVTHAIVNTMNKLRANPGARGLCTGIGWYNTKHAIGIYSTTPTEGEWRRDDLATIQAKVDARPKPDIAIKASGPATVESYTVINDREGPISGIVVGRLEDDRRFLAFTPKDPELFQRMMREEMIGTTGTVESGDLTNTFTPS